MKALRTWVNGKEDHRDSFEDSDSINSDGLFETMALLEGKIRFWDQHWQRLKRGFQVLELIPPDKQDLESQLKRFIAEQKKAVVKILFSNDRLDSALTSIFYLFEWPTDRESWLTKGVRVCLCQTRLGDNPQLAGLKHTDRALYLLARKEWGHKYSEGLMLDQSGNVIEGTISNVFVVKNNSVYTPLLDRCGVAGVMRNRIIQNLEESGTGVAQEALSVDNLMSADEVFLSNSVMGIWPVIQCNQQQFQFGPQAKRLQRLLMNGQLG